MKERLLKLLKGCISKERVVLSSGKVSSFYIDGRLITLHPEGAFLVASLMLDIIEDMDVDAVGGPTLGADPICGAIALLSHLRGDPIPTFIVRKEPKTHGMRRHIEGPLEKEMRVALVDDVVTTGSSLLRVARILRDEGHVVKGAIVIVDREEGAEESLKKENIPLYPLFRKQELL
jgi:orotate phosphoribosyltransferase